MASKFSILSLMNVFVLICLALALALAVAIFSDNQSRNQLADVYKHLRIEGDQRFTLNYIDFKGENHGGWHLRIKEMSQIEITVVDINENGVPVESHFYPDSLDTMITFEFEKPQLIVTVSDLFENGTRIRMSKTTDSCSGSFKSRSNSAVHQNSILYIFYNAVDENYGGLPESKVSLEELTQVCRDSQVCCMAIFLNDRKDK